MKTKNIIISLLLTVTCCCLWSCGDDKEEPKNPLIGAWELTNGVELLEQQVVSILMENNALTQENINILQRIKEILETFQVVVQFNADGTSRMYSYRNGFGLFVSGTWTITEQGIILQAGNMTLLVTNIVTDGTVMQCNVGDITLQFQRYKKE